jgi:LPXTG-site transpeptidase (sortase) family protein
MENNTQIQTKNDAGLPQVIEVKVPVHTGMSNSMFVVWFVLIFIVAFVLLSYFGLVPEGVREINATLFSFSGTSISANQNQVQALVDPLATTSQKADSLVISPELSQMPTFIMSNAVRQQSQNLGTVYQTSGKVLPTRLVIEKIGVDTPISNPSSTDVAVLDKALLSGGVRYPASATLEENGNVLLFGHSTTLAVVRNQAYKAFVGIGTLTAGDQIKVRSTDNEYLYSVTKVSKVSADKELVLFPATGRMLTLSTCDLLGTKADRFVVEAQFVRRYPLAK